MMSGATPHTVLSGTIWAPTGHASHMQTSLTTRATYWCTRIIKGEAEPHAALRGIGIL